MFRYLIGIFVSWLIFTGSAYADQNIRLIYGHQDQYSNNTVLDKATFKIIHDVDSQWDIDFRVTYGNAQNKDSTLLNYEIGTRYKKKVANGFILYARPEIGTIKISNQPWRNFIGLEVGTLLRPFENKKIGFKIDHAWTTGIDNSISDGTLTRFQTTYDISAIQTVGVRYDQRRGNPVEFNTINFIYGLRFKGI
tara:strand:- start:138 stop:719 length:582 start_codon:yes stop_codon:yes gene_type:complete